MFENFGTAIVQAVGFFGVFGFFVYRLLSEKSNDYSEENSKRNFSKPVKSVTSEKKGLFGRKKKVEQNIDKNKKEIKKGWFRR